MSVLAALLVAGVVLTVVWSGTTYQVWEPRAADGPDGTHPDESVGHASVRVSTLRYLRGVAVALVGGFWAGALVTGPAVRLIMRLLAVTAGDDAQGRLTEADEVVGSIDLDGTIGLYLFGGILPGLLSGALYVVFRRWLPSGRAAGLAFGALHLIVAATRIDPLRADNPDFDLVGPGWLSVATFGLASVVHGLAVVAFANRFSSTFPPGDGRRLALRHVLPLVPPVLLLVPGVFLVLLLVLGLAVTIVLTRFEPIVRAVRSQAAVVVGRVVLSVLALALLPAAIVDLRDVIDRDDAAAPLIED